MRDSDSVAYIVTIFYRSLVIHVLFQFRGEIWQPLALRSERHHFGRVVDSFVLRHYREVILSFMLLQVSNLRFVAVALRIFRELL